MIMTSDVIRLLQAEVEANGDLEFVVITEIDQDGITTKELDLHEPVLMFTQTKDKNIIAVLVNQNQQ